MPLRWIEVENYRAIAKGRVTFGDTTVLFGENDSGRTSIIEALMLCLGVPTAGPDELSVAQFHHGADGRPGPMHIRLGIDEGRPGVWSLPERLADALPAGDGARQLVFDFRADLDPITETGRLSHTILSPLDSIQVEGREDTTGCSAACSRCCGCNQVS